MPKPSPTSSAPWDAAKKPSGKRWLTIAAALALIALIVWAFRPKPTVVETAQVARMPLTVYVSEEGKTRVVNRYTVSSPVAGTMRRLTLKAGDAVAPDGPPIVTIEPADTPLLDSSSRQQAEAALAMQEAARKQAQGTYDAAATALKLATADRERVRSLRNSAAISQSDRDKIEADVTIKEAQKRSAEFALQVIDQQIAQAKAVLDRPANVPGKNLVTLTAPVAGEVLRVFQESRTVVAPGMPILEVGDPQDIEIEAEILSRDAVGIQPGDAVEIDQWGGPGTLKARVRRIEPAAFTKVSALGVEEQRVLVLCDFAEGSEKPRLGDQFRVEVKVATWHGDDVLCVPAGALFRKGADWMVFTDDSGTAREKKVEIGHSNGLYSEVVSGISEGQKVLLHPPDNVQDGTAISSGE